MVLALVLVLVFDMILPPCIYLCSGVRRPVLHGDNIQLRIKRITEKSLLLKLHVFLFTGMVQYTSAVLKVFASGTPTFVTAVCASVSGHFYVELHAVEHIDDRGLASREVQRHLCNSYATVEHGFKLVFFCPVVCLLLWDAFSEGYNLFIICFRSWHAFSS